MFALPRSLPRRIALLALALMFVVAGALHFTMPDFYVSIMPPYLPGPLELVYLSGVLEILGGLGLLVAPIRRVTGYALIALLAAVYLTNIHMALNPGDFTHLASRWALSLRLPVQFVFAVWVWWATLPEAPPAQAQIGVSSS